MERITRTSVGVCLIVAMSGFTFIKDGVGRSYQYIAIVYGLAGVDLRAP